MEDKFLWWKDGIIYQIYPRSFSDSNQDGIGDLPGITARLDYLHDLGVDAIWLSPVYPSPQADFGYDVSNYVDIDPVFGSLKDYDNLIRAAHKRKIRVIMDLVLNHTSDEHPWFIESRKSRDNPYRDWYIWRDPSPRGHEPNNWYSIFGGKAWKFDPATGQYYLHLFHEKQPDLNWRNPKVQKAILAVLKFWLDRGTDGFRLDVFNAYFKHPDLPDNPSTKWGLRGYERQDHIYDGDQPEMIPVLQQFRKLMDRYAERYSVGETFYATPEKAAFYSGDDRLHAAFNFTMLESKWDSQSYLKAIKEWDRVAGKMVWPNYVLNNHDNPRTVTRWKDNEDDRRAKLAATMLLTLRGTPFLYYGEEIGMRDIKLKRSDIMDPPGKKYWPFYKGRDGCRSPMQWDDSSQAGFTTGRPWLPVHHNHKTRNVVAQSKNEHSILNVYRKLIDLRRRSIALQRGDFALINQSNPNCLVYQRKHTKQCMLVALNFSQRPQIVKLDLAGSDKWVEIFSTHTLQKAPDSLSTLKLESSQAAIFELQTAK
ncbi:MAG: alpha-glucosidase [Anaerolineaceae bacterium]|nr:alpha-glucosidase [Anaerolineaceae bacterium]MBN2678128.1 alpha-glucosidase [Anaerolineaceae bacterium]